MSEKREHSQRLRLAELCCDLYMRQGTTRATVAEIASAVDVSDRTFYRYFPVKAESVAPVFDAMTISMNTVVESHPSAPLRQVVLAAFREMFTTRVTSRANELFPLILADREMWALFLRKVHDGETSLAPLLAKRLGLPPEHDRARAAAAAIASATRIALERTADSDLNLERAFTNILDAFGPSILSPATPEGSGALISAAGTTS